MSANAKFSILLINLAVLLIVMTATGRPQAGLDGGPFQPQRGFEQAQSLGGSRRGFQTGGEDQTRLRRGPFQSRRNLFESPRSESRKGRLRDA